MSCVKLIRGPPALLCQRLHAAFCSRPQKETTQADKLILAPHSFTSKCIAYTVPALSPGRS